jgi:hypothetical protein
MICGNCRNNAPHQWSQFKLLLKIDRDTQDHAVFFARATS